MILPALMITMGVLFSGIGVWMLRRFYDPKILMCVGETVMPLKPREVGKLCLFLGISLLMLGGTWFWFGSLSEPLWFVWGGCVLSLSGIWFLSRMYSIDESPGRVILLVLMIFGGMFSCFVGFMGHTYP